MRSPWQVPFGTKCQFVADTKGVSSVPLDTSWLSSDLRCHDLLSVTSSLKAVTGISGTLVAMARQPQETPYDAFTNKIASQHEAIEALEATKMNMAYEIEELKGKISWLQTRLQEECDTSSSLREQLASSGVEVQEINLDELDEPASSSSPSSPPSYQPGVLAAQAAKLELRRETQVRDSEKMDELFNFLASMEEAPDTSHQVPRVTSASRSSSSNRPISPRLSAVARPTKAPRYR